MRLRSCRHETELKQLLELGHWPHSCADELREHVAGCRACSDLVLLTQAFRGARAESSAAAYPPPASVLWWRAQLRRRNAAVKRIQRPLLGAQVFAFAVALVLMAAVLIYEAIHGMPWIAAMAGWFESLKQSTAFHLDALWPFTVGQSSTSLMYLLPGAAMLLLLGGVVVYLATEKQ
jgi:hypothetical protein